MANSKALTKIQSIILFAIIAVAAIGGAAYVLLVGDNQSEDIIKIGFCGDLDMYVGGGAWKAARLAVEHLNAEGGILGKQIEIIGEDSDYESTGDIVVASQAFTRLITVDKVDFIVSSDGDRAIGTYQEISSEHKKIYISCVGGLETFTQRVLDEYDKYKYYFRTFPSNYTSLIRNYVDSLDTLRDYTGFNKVGFLTIDAPSIVELTNAMASILENNYGFDVVYTGKYGLETVDFSSYYSRAEDAGVEIFVPLTIYQEGIPLAKEWYDRQSPMVTWGLNAIISSYNGWEAVEGKCEDMALNAPSVTAGYPFTSKSLPLRDSFFDRWGDIPDGSTSAVYDTIRYILADAIERVGTVESEAVIEALEKTSIETSMVRDFVFTESHDVMVGENVNDPNADYMLGLFFQWQDGEMVPVYPKSIMEKAGVTYMYPPWSGPWDE